MSCVRVLAVSLDTSNTFIGSLIFVVGAQIAVKSTINYLGLVLNSRGDFGPHTQRLHLSESLGVLHDVL